MWYFEIYKYSSPFLGQTKNKKTFQQTQGLVLIQDGETALWQL